MGNISESCTVVNLFDIDMTFFLATTMLTLGRMWMDVFILAVNCRDWRKKKCLSLIDRILTLQGSIKIGHGCVTILWYTLAKFCPWITKLGDFYRAFMSVLWYSISCNAWLTASLCSCYCVKIADFRHPIFLRLKLRLPGLVIIWLLGSMVLSVPTSLTFWFSNLEIEGHRNHYLTIKDKNVTHNIQTGTELHIFVLVGLGCLAAFIICVTSAVLLLFSLWRHHQRMRGHWEGHRSPQSNAHFQALIIILSLLINNIVIFVSILLMLSSDFNENSDINVVATAVLNACFLVESFLSLGSNKKLRNELSRALYFAKCRGCAT